MKRNGKISIINLILIMMLVICLTMGVLLIIISRAKIQVNLAEKSGNRNYATTEETTNTNTWDISATENDNVIATLSEDGILTISGTGNMKDLTSQHTPWYSTIEKIKYIIIEDGVTSIGEYAFSDCYNLINIEISNTITTIGIGAFSNCWSLTSVKLPNSITSISKYTFMSCDSLKNVEIPNSVISIGKNAFYGCDKLISLDIPDSVTNIEEDAFDYCKVTKLIEPTNNNIDLPNILKRAQDENDILYWENGYELTNCTIQDSILKINEGCIYAEIEITSGKLKGLTYFISHNSWDVSANGDGSVMGSLADDGKLTISGTGNMKNFADLEAWLIVDSLIKQIEIKDGVNSIGEHAFSWCYFLTNIKIPSSVTSIADTALEGCTSLINIEVDDNNVNYMDDNGVLYTKDQTKIIKYPAWKEETEYTISNKVKIIGYAAFECCYGLTKLNIPNGVTHIEEYAFYDCYRLTNMRIPGSVSRIGEYAFYCCQYLEKVQILEGVTTIDNYAFAWCPGLTSIIIPSSVTSMGIDVFEKSSMIDNDDLTIICQKGTTAETYAKENNIKYVVIMSEIKPKTTVKQFKQEQGSEIEYKITDKNGEDIAETEYITTGCKIEMTSGEKYVIIVKGDSTGDGEADFSDILAINKHRLNKADLTGEYLLASDVDGDGISDFKDILQINKFRLGKIEEL